jgi:hypothetical protein
MAPTPAGTASCIACRAGGPGAPRRRSRGLPRRPAPRTRRGCGRGTPSGDQPSSSRRTVHAAIEQVRIAGWVLAVRASCSSGPSKHRVESGSPSASSASSKIRRAAGTRPPARRPCPSSGCPDPGTRRPTCSLIGCPRTFDKGRDLDGRSSRGQQQAASSRLAAANRSLWAATAARRRASGRGGRTDRPGECVAQGLRAGAAVADDRHAVDPEQRRAAVVVGVEALLEGAKVGRMSRAPTLLSARSSIAARSCSRRRPRSPRAP